MGEGPITVCLLARQGPMGKEYNAKGSNSGMAKTNFRRTTKKGKRTACVPGELVKYQKGAIVSKEFAKSGGGTMTVFAFWQGEGLSEHTAPFDAIVQVLDGEASITVSGNREIVKKGEMLLMPAGKPHSLKAGKRFKMLLTMIKK